MSVVVGVDAGGTKTDLLVVRSGGGGITGRARGGTANHEVIGYDAAAAVLAGILSAALADAGIPRSDVVASAWALAGVDWPSDDVALRPLLQGFGLPGPLVLVNDVFAVLRAGVPAGPAAVVVSGTGVVAAGRDAGGRTWRTLGQGAGVGDWGSGPDVVRAAVNAVASADMGLGPATRLTSLVLQRSGSTEVMAALERVYRHLPAGGPGSAPPALTPAEVWDVAAQGDGVALGIADRVAESLCAAVGAVVRRLDLASAGSPFDVVLAGRVLDPGHPLLHDHVVSRLAAAVPLARPRRLGVEPVVGAAQLAADAAGWTLDASWRG